MRLLYIADYPPRPLSGGAEVRAHHLGRALLARHEVWACLRGVDGEGGWAGELPLPDRDVSRTFLKQAAAVIEQEEIEAIVATGLNSGRYGARLKKLTGVDFWMDEHNAEWHNARRAGYRLWPLIFMLEKSILRHADWVTCVSPEDQQRLTDTFHLEPERVIVAPNGADFRQLHDASHQNVPRFADRGHRAVLFFGLLDYAPNREAVRVLAEEIQPKSPEDIQFIVAGKGGDDLARRFPNLRFEGFVDDIHTLIRQCDGVLVPLRSGGGTRLKILESIACGRPVLSTVVGAEGLSRSAIGSGLTVTDDLDATLEWLEALGPQVEVEPGAEFERTYDWDVIWTATLPLVQIGSPPSS